MTMSLHNFMYPGFTHYMPLCTSGYPTAITSVHAYQLIFCEFVLSLFCFLGLYGVVVLCLCMCLHPVCSVCEVVFELSGFFNHTAPPHSHKTAVN